MIADKAQKRIQKTREVPVPINGTKSSTVTSTPISANKSTPALLEGSSLLQSTPSMSNNTAETLPHSPDIAATFFSSTFTAQAFTANRGVKTRRFDRQWKNREGSEAGLGRVRFEENKKSVEVDAVGRDSKK